MLIPVGDDHSRRTAPILNGLLILLNVAVSFYVFTRPDEEIKEIVKDYALVPNAWTSIQTLFTSMFLHGDWVHLLGNMLFLWTVGNSVEDRMGHLQYFVFYLVAGLAGSIGHVIMATGPLPSMAAIPTVGASGAVWGIIGAYLVLFPGTRIKLAFILLPFWPVKVPAWVAIGLWIAYQVLMARNQLDGVAKGETAMVAVFAHFGGFAFGFGATFLLRISGKMKIRKDGG